MYLHSDIIRLHGVSRVYLWIVALRECQESLLLPFASYILATVGKNCKGGDARALPVCRFSPLLRHRGVATVDGGGGGSVQSLISWSTDRRACESICNWHSLLGLFATCSSIFRCPRSSRPCMQRWPNDSCELCICLIALSLTEKLLRIVCVTCLPTIRSEFSLVSHSRTHDNQATLLPPDHDFLPCLVRVPFFDSIQWRFKTTQSVSQN